MPQESFETLVWKVLSGDANAQEIGALERIVNNSEERKLEYEKISLVWNSTQINQKFNTKKQEILAATDVATIDAITW